MWRAGEKISIRHKNIEILDWSNPFFCSQWQSLFLLSVKIAFLALLIVKPTWKLLTTNASQHTDYWVFYSTLPAHLTFIHPITSSLVPSYHLYFIPSHLISSHLCAIDNTNEVESSDQESKNIEIFLSIWVYFLLEFQIELQTILKNKKRNISCIYKTDIFFWCDFRGWAKFKPIKNIVSKNIL